MQDGTNPKQLIAENIKQSANILVTVSANPSVDSLTAALGLTLMLNKLDKHATAVFSGVIPPAINFLEPGKTFENNVDSLRDFIIALDKDKADRLRYKVEDDVVRIFITPYRTRISQKDLQFSQGDFNVDLIVALGVEDQKDLDQALAAHGRILHDAAVVTINASAQKSSLGSIDWQDGNASSLSEMLVGLAELVKPGILDRQISTALLTGIVASTERFSNQHTTPRVMTIAAQLMAAGANQQLIATKLQTIPAPVSPRRDKKPMSQQSTKIKEPQREDDGTNGEMHIQHDEEPAAIVPKKSAEEVPPAPIEPVVEQSETEPELPIAPPAAQGFNDLKEAIREETVRSAPQREMTVEPPAPGSRNINADEDEEERSKPEEDSSYLTTHPSWQGREIQPPTMGGTLNATAEQALEDKRRSETEEKRNHTILTHGAPANPPAASAQQPNRSSKRKRSKQKQQQTSAQSPASVPEPQTPISPAQGPAPATESPTVPPVPMAPPAQEEQPAPGPATSSAPAEPVAEQPAAPQPVQDTLEQLPELPVAPPPLVVSEPLTPPAEQPIQAPAPQQPVEASAPAPKPLTQIEAAPQSEVPAPQAAPSTPLPSESSAQPLPATPTIEELQRQAASHAVESVAPQTLTELERERRQAEAASAPPAPESAPMPQMPAMPGSLPPMPDFGTLPPASGTNPPQLPQLPQLPEAPATEQPQTPQNPTPPTPTDPGQYRIPGQ